MILFEILQLWYFFESVPKRRVPILDRGKKIKPRQRNLLFSPTINQYYRGHEEIHSRGSVRVLSLKPNLIIIDKIPFDTRNHHHLGHPSLSVSQSFVNPSVFRHSRILKSLLFGAALLSDFLPIVLGRKVLPPFDKIKLKTAWTS